MHLCTYLLLSIFDKCLEPLCIWAHCGMHEPRLESGKGSCSWRLVLSVSGGKSTHSKKCVFTYLSPPCFYLHLCCHVTLVQLSKLNLIGCVWWQYVRWEVPCFIWKKSTCHKAMTSSGSWNQHGLQEPESRGTGMNQSNIASSCCNAATSVMESRETAGKVKRLPAKIGSDNSAYV